MSQGPFYILDQVAWDEVRRIKQKIDSLSGPGVTNSPGSVTLSPSGRFSELITEGGRTRPLLRLRVKTIANDYLTCRTWDGTNEGSADINVARPVELRHDVDYYPGLTSLTTVNAQEVTATDGADTETWKVTPDYVVDGEIWATVSGPGTGVTVSGTELRWVDLNLAGRAWAALGGA